MKLFILLAIALLSFGCQSDEQPAAPQPGTMGQMPHPPGGPMGGGTAAGNPAAVGIEYDLPEGWNRVPPASSMRIDQATIPGPAGSGEMAVFFFGAGSGGGVQANLDRWVAQVDSASPPTQESFESNGMKITWLDVSGTLKPSSMGMGPATDQPNSRMFAAVVEGEGGPWFFKITGPQETLAGEREDFLAMLRSVRKPANV